MAFTDEMARSVRLIARAGMTPGPNLPEMQWKRGSR